MNQKPTQALRSILETLAENAELEKAYFEETVPQYTIVLCNAEAVGRGPKTARVEACLLEAYENSLLLAFKDGNSGYYSPDVIEDVIDENPSDTKLQLEFKITAAPKYPEPPPTPNYETGTYILDSAYGPKLVEVDRVDSTYYIRLSNGYLVEPLTVDIWQQLEQFSDPDNGNYLVEPGVYFIKSEKALVEVVPYRGQCYYRVINGTSLILLDPAYVPDMARVETDTLEVNAAIIVNEQTQPEPPTCCRVQPHPTDACPQDPEPQAEQL